MTWNRPTLPELLARARADLKAAIPDADPALRRSVVRALADTHAGGCHELHGFLAWLARQLMAASAEAEFLDAHGLEWVGARLPASQAVGSITLTGTDGAVTPAGAVFRRADGIEYAVNADVTLISGTATAAVTCNEYGETGNADAGASLTLANPIAGVNSTGVVAAGGLSGGTDSETDASYRARILYRKRTPPELGNAADYIRWAKSVSGVTRAWVSNELGPGAVMIRFVRDDDTPSIYPNAEAIAVVKAYILTQAPYPADIHVAAPTPVPVVFNLRLTPDTLAVRAAVTAALADLLFHMAVPGGTLLVSDIGETIGAAAGVADWHIVAPSADIVFSAAEIGEMGSINWD